MLLLAAALVIAFAGGLFGTLAATSWIAASRRPVALEAPRFVDETRLGDRSARSLGVMTGLES